MMMMGRGVVVAASLWGKLKAITYAVSGVFGVLVVSFERLGVLPGYMDFFKILLLIVFYLSAFAALASFLIYLRAAKE